MRSIVNFMMVMYCPGSGYVPNGSIKNRGTMLLGLYMKDKDVSMLVCTL